MPDPLRPHAPQPFRLLRSWNFPGKSIGVGCHCLLRNEDLVLAKEKKINNRKTKNDSPRETSEVSREAGHEK